VMTAGTADRTDADKRAGILYPAMLIAAIGVIVFSVVGIASMMGWMPGVFSGGSAATGSAGASSAGAVRPQVTLAPPCDDCGTIESIRAHRIEQDKKSAVTYQITVRMSDGTTRAVYEPTPPAHAIGERVRVSERGLVVAR
jgi:hypothetical protein